MSIGRCSAPWTWLATIRGPPVRAPHQPSCGPRLPNWAHISSSQGQKVCPVHRDVRNWAHISSSQGQKVCPVHIGVRVGVAAGGERWHPVDNVLRPHLPRSSTHVAHAPSRVRLPASRIGEVALVFGVPARRHRPIQATPGPLARSHIANRRQRAVVPHTQISIPPTPESLPSCSAEHPPTASR